MRFGSHAGAHFQYHLQIASLSTLNISESANYLLLLKKRCKIKLTNN